MDSKRVSPGSLGPCQEQDSAAPACASSAQRTEPARSSTYIGAGGSDAASSSGEPGGSLCRERRAPESLSPSGSPRMYGRVLAAGVQRGKGSQEREKGLRGVVTGPGSCSSSPLGSCRGHSATALSTPGWVSRDRCAPAEGGALSGWAPAGARAGLRKKEVGGSQDTAVEPLRPGPLCGVRVGRERNCWAHRPSLPPLSGRGGASLTGGP